MEFTDAWAAISDVKFGWVDEVGTSGCLLALDWVFFEPWGISDLL